MTVGEIYDILLRCASGVYDSREAEAVARYVMCERFGVDRVQLALEKGKEIADTGDLHSIAEDLAAGRPAQYITGAAWFCGIKFAVAEGVLIPRPETEQLVEWIVSEAPANPSMLDIGTGSGAIAVALAYKLEAAEITATDISPDALEIARRNAQSAGAKVKFIRNDILDTGGYSDLAVAGGYDRIISNPPYIPVSQQRSMHRNVKSFEPHGALFVPDGRPILFYDAIAGFAESYLKSGGKLYFEAHEHYAEEVGKMLSEKGFRNVEIRNDINGKARMVRANKI